MGSRRNIYSKSTSIHGPYHNQDLNLSYSRRQFSRLSQAVSGRFIISLSQNVSYHSMVIGPVIIGFSPNEEISHLQIFDHSIITFEKFYFCLRFSNTSQVDSLDRFRKVVIENFHNAIEIKIKHCFKEDEKLIYANGFIYNMGLGNTIRCVYHFPFDK